MKLLDSRRFCLAPLCAITVAIMAVTIVGQTATTAKPVNPLVGFWKSDIATVEIRANGTLKINDDEYVYKVKNSVINVSNEGGSAAFPYVLRGDTLIVELDGQEIVYKRMKGSPGTSAVSPDVSSAGGVIPEFVGKWCYLASLGGTSSYRSDRCFVLYANGTYEYSSEVSSSGSAGSSVGSSYDSGRWSATRTTLTAFSQKNGKIVYPIELRNHPKTGDPMIVVDGDAYVTQTQKRPW
jgi:hypothetical protein